MNKISIRIAAILCAMLLIWPIGCYAVSADTLEDQLLGTVSAKYESNGDPGTISGGTGDLGGASYGAYQFASKFNVPLTFAKWCVSSGKNETVGNRLIAAYEKDGNAFGNNFNAVWKQLAKDDKNGFLRLQRQYIKTQYYDPAVTALKTNFKLEIGKYGIAFKNAVWSRTVQHGLGSYSSSTGFMGIMKQVDKQLPGGILGSSEKDLIQAIYEESGKVVSSGTNAMKAAEAGGNRWIIEKYNLEGKYLKYYSGNSSAVQAGVYLRLRVNEIADLQEMLQEYGGFQATGEHGEVTPSFQNGTLLLSECETLRGFVAGGNTALEVTSAHRQGSKAVALKPSAAISDKNHSVSAALRFALPVNLTGFRQIQLEVYLSAAQSNADSCVTIEFKQDQKNVFTGEWSLTSLSKGWHTVTIALPASEDLGMADRVTIRLQNLSGGDQFIIDHIRAVTPEPDKTLQSAIVDADALNCRSGPDSDYTSYGMFPGDSVIDVLGQAVNGWYFCSGFNENGEKILGWCSGEYLLLESYVVHSGDVNGDGVINAQDALLVLRFAVHKVTLTDEQQTIADVTRDGKIDAGDALVILRTAVGK